MPQSGREWAFVEVLETTAYSPSSSTFPCDENKNKKCSGKPHRCSNVSFLAWFLGRTLRDGEVVACPAVNWENVRVCCWTERKGDGNGMLGMVVESTEVMCAEKAFEVRHYDDSSEGCADRRLGVVRRKCGFDDMVVAEARARVIQSLSSGGGGSILIHGAPGVGKTILALSIIETLHCSMVKVSPGRLVAYAGAKADAALARAFAYVRGCGGHQIVMFLDDLDRLIPVLEGDNNVDPSDVDFGLLCRLMLEIGSSDLTIVATAVLPNGVDKRVRRCFSDEILLRSPTASKLSAAAAGTLKEEEECTISNAQSDAAAGSRNQYETVKRPDMVMNLQARLSSVEAGGNIPKQLLLSSRKWENIGGHAAIKQALMEAVIWPRCFPESFSKLNIAPPCGILFHGPPGTGKTLLAHAAASAMGYQWVELRASDVAHCFVGESEGIIRDAFSTAAECAPSLLFIDEFDALFSERGEGGIGSRLTSELLLCMDELQKFQKMGVKTGQYVALIAATNALKAIDKAFLRPGRFDRTLFVDLPSMEDRLEILRIASAHMGGIEPGVDLGGLATITCGFSGADIVHLLSQASILQFVKQGGLEKISRISNHLDHQVVESLTLESIYEALERHTNI